MLSGLNRRLWLAATTTVLGFGMSLSALAAAPDAKLGKQKFYTCYGCHGIESYKNAYPDYNVPKLRHQTAEYITAALQEYKVGERPHATMHAQAASMSAEDMADIAAYLQGPAPAKPVANPSAAPAAAAACVACHGDTGLGVDAPLAPKPPILAGQHEDYLEQALRAYRNGRRKNIIMSGMAQSLKEEDINVVAAYFAAQASPLAVAKVDSQ